MPVSKCHIACINMRQHIRPMAKRRKIFHRMASACIPRAENVRVCRSLMINWQQLTNFRGHFAPRQELAASATEARRLFERGKHSRTNPSA